MNEPDYSKIKEALYRLADNPADNILVADAFTWGTEKIFMTSLVRQDAESQKARFSFRVEQSIYGQRQGWFYPDFKNESYNNWRPAIAEIKIPTDYQTGQCPYDNYLFFAKFVQRPISLQPSEGVAAMGCYIHVLAFSSLINLFVEENIESYSPLRSALR